MKTLVVVSMMAAACGGAQATGPGAAAPTEAVWDATAAEEARAFWELSFQSMMDMEVFAGMLASDGFVGAFDIDMDNKPITFATRDEAVAFMTQMASTLKAMGGSVTAKTRSLECAATSTMAVCRGELDFAVTGGGQTVTQASRVTGTFRKGADGWKWTHWHASLAVAPAMPEPPPPPPAPAPPPEPPKPTYQGATINEKDLKWAPPPGAPPGVEGAIVFGDPKTGPHAMFVKFPKKLSLPAHHHTANLWVVMVKGSFTVTGPGGATHELKAGGYHLQPGGEIHTTESKGGATFFQFADGPFDVVPAAGK